MPVWKLSCSGNSIELYKHQLFVGRDDDCDITFKHKGIDIRHSVLNYDQRLGVFRLTDLGSSHGTFVNGESVCEESVPLYVGTRIMFGRNPMVWCVDVGEPSISHIPTETMTPHNYQIPQMNHGYSPIHVPYTSPRTAPMSYSFQTSFPLDRSSPQQDPLFNASKSYFGDSSPPSYSRDQSFAPGERRQSSASSRDPSFSDVIATDGPREPSVNSLQTDTEVTNSEIPTRAKTLYGQPSWWGDGSESYSTPPSQRREDKPDTPHPNKSIQPPSFSTKLYVGSTHVPHTYTQPNKDDFSLNDKSVSLFLEPRPSSAAPHTQQATEKDNKKTLMRQGSYEIESDQLDSSLVRPVIEPDPPFYTPYKSGRKSEVFIVDFGDEKIESKKPIRTASRNAKQSNLPRVKLAFKETQPIEITSDSEPELNFFSPPPLAQRQSGSVVSERGDEIGEPVTSSTPISILNEDQTTDLSLDPLQIVRQEPTDHKERRKRTTWTAPLEPTKCETDQSISEVSRNIDSSLTFAYTKTKLLYELLEKHLAPNFHSFSSQQDNTQATLAVMKQIEEKIESFSSLLGSVNVQELQETLCNLQSTSYAVNTGRIEPGARRGSFDSGVHSQTEKTTHSFHT